MIAGLDIATSTGVAIMQYKNSAKVYSVTGDPIFQADKIVGILLDNSVEVVYVEQLTDFRFVKTIASLSERLGYISWLLKSDGYEIRIANLNSVRRKLEIPAIAKTLKESLYKSLQNFTVQPASLTSDHSDALALCLYHYGLTIGNLSQNNFQISTMPPIVQPKKNRKSLERVKDASENTQKSGRKRKARAR